MVEVSKFLSTLAHTWSGRQQPMPSQEYKFVQHQIVQDSLMWTLVPSLLLTSRRLASSSHQIVTNHSITASWFSNFAYVIETLHLLKDPIPVMMTTRVRRRKKRRRKNKRKKPKLLLRKQRLRRSKRKWSKNKEKSRPLLSNNTSRRSRKRRRSRLKLLPNWRATERLG